MKILRKTGIINLKREFINLTIYNVKLSKTFSSESEDSSFED